MSRSIVAPVTLALLIVSAPAVACEQDPFLFRIQDETEAQARERASRIFADRTVARLYNRENSAFAKATQVYIARVTSTTRSPPTVVVTPLEVLKGKRRSGTQTLVDDGGPGLCDDAGDGLGAHANKGALVIVFEGLPKSTLRPRGIDSLQVNDVRTAPILYKLLDLYGSEDQ